MTYNTQHVLEDVTLDSILSKIDEYQIYCHYTNQKLQINKPVSSPFRNDKHPSWSLFWSNRGRLMYKDFATGDSGDVVKLVRELFKIPYRAALEKIWEDLVINGHIIPLTKENRSKAFRTPSTVISIKRKYFTTQDDQYWNQFGINRDTLKKFKVYPISTFWVNNKQSSITYTKEQPLYAYSIYNKFKIYNPYSKTKSNKWRTNCGPFDLQGLEQLPDNGDLLIITKSLKDVMVLYELGYTSVAPQSESTDIPETLIEHFKGRFKEIIIFFDNDDGGRKGALKLSNKFDIPCKFLPSHYNEIYNVKDISDYVKILGTKSIHKAIKELE